MKKKIVAFFLICSFLVPVVYGYESPLKRKRHKSLKVNRVDELKKDNIEESKDKTEGKKERRRKRRNRRNEVKRNKKEQNGLKKK